MIELPRFCAYSEEGLQNLKTQVQGLIFLERELRDGFAGEFPLHTRYFSNGDRPLVALVKHSGQAVFLSRSGGHSLEDGEMAFFDDSEPHGWSFQNATLEIFFFRQQEPPIEAATTGDYCLDDFFNPRT